jgi:broad specificity phosphatase PhoE
MTITFVRHGSTQWNRLARFQGQSDIPLDARGRAQAQALASLFAAERFDYAVSSDLSRAYDTACAIRAGAPVARDARWREFAFGEWEGLTWEQIVRRWPNAAERGRTAATLYAPPGGETFDQVLARVEQALSELRAGSYKNVLVVTHAGPLHAMLHAFFGSPESNPMLAVRLSPASVTRIAIEDGKAQLLALNEVAHLDDT